MRYCKPICPQDFKDARKAIKGNRVLPESFDNTFDCQQGRWYRGIQWICGRVRLVSHWSRAAVHNSIALQCQVICATYLGLWLETLLPELVTTCGMGTCMDGLNPWELPLLFPKVFSMLLQGSGSSALLLVLPLWGAKQSGQHWLMNGAQQQEVFHPGLFIVAPGFT